MTDWQDYAECKGTNTNLFFPERGTGSDEAKAVCSTCPVRLQCLQYALDNGETFGIWGGLSERQRRRVRKQRMEAGIIRVRPLKPIEHGSYNGSRMHRKRGEEPCDDCRIAHAAASAEYRNKKRSEAA